MYEPPSEGKKILLHIDHWMNSVGAHFAEIAAKMLATQRFQSDSTLQIDLSST